MTETTAAETNTPIVAKAGSYYRNVRYILSLACLLAAAWFCYDGFVAYPRENDNYNRVTRDLADAQQRQDSSATARLSEESKKYSLHSALDTYINKGIACVLPFVGIGLLVWMLRNSRGEYRLEDGVVHAPGHPPIPLASILRIDARLWDKKGIALVDYQLETGESGSFRLDDFVYQGKPIKAIYKAIEADILARATPDDDDAASDESPAEA